MGKLLCRLWFKALVLPVEVLFIWLLETQVELTSLGLVDKQQMVKMLDLSKSEKNVIFLTSWPVLSDSL